MSFGDREDELWEAMKPSFKPRLVSDPNIKYAKHLVNQTGPFATRGALTSLGRTDVRATLARAVRRAPEVLVKVTGRKKGAKHLAAHLDYIGRHGDIPLETRDGEQLATKEDAQRIRSEEHTSELQSLMRISYAVFCLKKKTTHTKYNTRHHTHTNKTTHKPPTTNTQ